MRLARRQDADQRDCTSRTIATQAPRTSEQRHSGNRDNKAQKIAPLILTAVIALIVSYWSSREFSVRIWSVTILIVGSAPAIFYTRGANWKELPILPLHGLFYAVTFGLSGLFADDSTYALRADHTNKAQILTLVGLTALYVGYYPIGRYLFQKSRCLRLRRTQTTKQLLVYGLALQLAFLVYRATNISFPTINQLMPVVGWMGKGLLLWAALSQTHQIGKLTTALIALTLLIDILMALSSGSLAQVLRLILFLAAIRSYFRGRPPYLAAIIAIATLVMLNPVKDAYREEIWRGSRKAQNLSSWSKAMLFIELALEPRDSAKETEYLDSVTKRIDHLGLMSYIVYATPRIVPHWEGESYRDMLTAVVPRILWPGKPEANLGNRWAHRYGLLTAEDDQTSFNLPWLPEFYMNFGQPGIVIGMLLIGILFRGMTAKLSSPDPMVYIIGAAIALPLWYAESNLAAMWGSTLTLYIAMRLTVWMISR